MPKLSSLLKFLLFVFALGLVFIGVISAVQLPNEIGAGEDNILLVAQIGVFLGVGGVLILIGFFLNWRKKNAPPAA